MTAPGGFLARLAARAAGGAGVDAVARPRLPSRFEDARDTPVSPPELSAPEGAMSTRRADNSPVVAVERPAPRCPSDELPSAPAELSAPTPVRATTRADNSQRVSIERDRIDRIERFVTERVHRVEHVERIEVPVVRARSIPSAAAPASPHE